MDLFYLLILFSIEKLSIPVFEALIEVLREHRGNFLEAVCGKVSQIVMAFQERSNLDKRYRFESIASASLKKEPPNSSRLVEFCELDTEDLIECSNGK